MSENPKKPRPGLSLNKPGGPAVPLKTAEYLLHFNVRENSNKAELEFMRRHPEDHLGVSA